jgi:hypothetical protein
MVIGADTFAGDVAARLGLANVFGANVFGANVFGANVFGEGGSEGENGHEGERESRYPKVTLAGIAARRPELIVLPDEPYQFSAADGPEAFPGQRVALVAGRDLTWYGPSLVTARERLTARLALAGHR